MRAALAAVLVCGLVSGCETPSARTALSSLSACHAMLAQGDPHPTPLPELVTFLEGQQVQRAPTEPIGAWQTRYEGIIRAAREFMTRQSGQPLVVVTANLDTGDMAYDAAQQTLTIGSGEWQRGLIPVTFFYGAGGPGEPRQRWTAYAGQTEERALGTVATAARVRTPRSITQIERQAWGIAFDGDYATVEWPPAFVAGLPMTPQAEHDTRAHLRLLLVGRLNGPLLITDDIAGYERPSPTTLTQVTGMRKLVTVDLACAVIYDDRSREVLYTIRNARP